MCSTANSKSQSMFSGSGKKWRPREVYKAEVDDLDCVAFHHKDFAGFEDAMNKAVLMGGL